ncbi:MAG: HAD family hydrolase [Candidatus Asgardarchaeia archaeon]
MIKCILLDLDQTLAMPEQGYKFQDEILKGYTKVLSEFFNIPMEKVVKVVLEVVEEVKRDPQEKYTIAERLFFGFAKKLGVTIIEMLEATDYYYFNEFIKLEKHYKATTGAYEVTKELVDEGYHLAIATDPLIRLFGVVMRIKWIGLERIPFCFISSADTSHAAKPHPLFYKEIVEKCFCKPNEAVMVGDLIENDIIGAKKAGLKTILFVHDLNKEINKKSIIKPDAIIHNLYELPSITKKF